MPLAQLVGVEQIVWVMPLPEAQSDGHDCFWQAVTLAAHVWQAGVSAPWQAPWQVVSPAAQPQKQSK